MNPVVRGARKVRNTIKALVKYFFRESSLASPNIGSPE